MHKFRFFKSQITGSSGLINDSVIEATHEGKNDGRNEAINELTKFFLINSIELVACFLISLFEGEHIEMSPSKDVAYNECEDFNEYWDELYGEFVMGNYSYTASEILYNNDPSAYESEYNSFIESDMGDTED